MPHYRIAWRNPNDRLYDISIRFRAPEDDPLLWLPAWRPGRYLIMNFAADVREWSANLRKVGKSQWRVNAKRGDEVEVTYRYFAATLDAGSSFLAEDEAYVNPSNLLMCVDALRGERCTLSLDAPVSWRIETQLTDFVARDYDHLIDSPIIASPDMRVHSFEESGATISMVFRNAHRIDTEALVEPVRKIVREQAAFFGGLPLREYRFLFHAGDRWHGVEHEDSCSIIMNRKTEGTDYFVSMVSHEFFHLWNVKRIIPAAFKPYDYLRETPTRLLWVMEGLTSYYGDLMLLRSGVWTQKRYLEDLASEIQRYESSPGKEVLSLAQASFDGWLSEQMHDRANAWFSFYDKGKIVGALLDIELRRRGRTLDEVMLALWRDYGQMGRGVEEDAVERIVGLSEFFARYVDGTEPLPYEELFAAAGVEFVSHPRAASLGMKVVEREGALIAEAVTRGGPAMTSGMLAGDEVLAIDGMRTKSIADAERAVKRAGENEIEILFAHAGIAMRRMVSARATGAVNVELKAANKPSALRDAWLRRDA